jgi:hypothetical protein
MVLTGGVSCLYVLLSKGEPKEIFFRNVPYVIKKIKIKIKLVTSEATMSRNGELEL